MKIDKQQMQELLTAAMVASDKDAVIRIAGGRLSVAGSSLASSITVSAGVDCHDEASMTVDGKRLLAFIKAGSGESVTCNFEKRSFKIARSRMSFASYEPEHHTTFDMSGGDEQGSSMGFAPIALAIAACTKACGDDDTRAWSTGVHFTGSEAFGTDGHRLVRVSGVDCPALEGTTIPKQALQQLAAVIGQAEGRQVLVRQQSGMISFSGVGFDIRCRLIDGQYPNTAPVFERCAEQQWASYPNGSMQAAIAQVASVKPPMIKLRRDDTDELGVFSDDAASKASAVAFGSGVQIAADETVGVNPRYASELMGIFDEDAEISLSLCSGSAPIGISSPMLPTVTAIVMPMRT